MSEEHDGRAAPREVDEAIDLREQLRSRRHGLTFRQHLAEPDRYGVVLVLILGAMFAGAALEDGPFERALSIAILGGTLLFALWTSRARHRTMRIAQIAVVVLFLTSLVVASQSSKLAKQAFSVIVCILVLAVLGAIIRRMTTHLTVSGSTVLAGLCIYLLIGLLYATIYGFIASWGEGRMFVQNTSPDSIDTLYFSLITMTTVGYGDLTPAGSVPKMLAASEALIGQMYLVTAVALLVGNLGRTRRQRGGGAGGSQGG
jgi:hypothetical protein